MRYHICQISYIDKHYYILVIYLKKKIDILSTSQKFDYS